MFRTFVSRTKQTNYTHIIKKNKNNLNKAIKKDNNKHTKNTNNKTDILTITDEKLKKANKNIFLL